MSVQESPTPAAGASEPELTRWQAWLAESEALTADILERREGAPLDVDALWRAARADLEARDDRVTSADRIV